MACPTAGRLLQRARHRHPDRAILRDFPQYYSFFGQQEFTYRGKTMYNTNHLLGKMPGVDGLKTGFTNAAGFNLDASAMRNGHRLIAVVMGSSSSAVRNANVEGLLLTGFDILERRDRGEKLAMTQTMFGAPHEGSVSVVRPPVWQGEGDADPIGVVLTRTTSSPAPVAVSQTMAPVRQRRPLMSGGSSQLEGPGRRVSQPAPGPRRSHARRPSIRRRVRQCRGLGGRWRPHLPRSILGLHRIVGAGSLQRGEVAEAALRRRRAA